MKTLMKPIDMIAWFTKEGVPHPIKYRLEQDSSMVTVKVDRVVTVDKERLAGNQMLIFKCQSVIDGVEKLYELKFELATCKWFLYKI